MKSINKKKYRFFNMIFMDHTGLSHVSFSKPDWYVLLVIDL